MGTGQGWFMMVRIGLSILLSLVLVSDTLAENPVTEEWVARYNRTISNAERASAVALDGFGNVFVTGTSTGENSASDIVTIKYDANGNELWTALLAVGRGGGAAGLGVDSGGNVYVAGTSDQMFRNSIVVVKYGPSGSTIWEARYNGPDNANDVAVALAVDSHGNAYVTGVEWQAGYSGQGIVTIKFDPSGNHLWSARTGGTFEEPNAIAVDTTGNVYIAGHTVGAGVSYAFAILKYDAAGGLAWIRHYGESGSNATALALDDAGNVYGAGRYQTYERSYPLTIKYDPNGNLLWASVLSSGGAVSGIAVDHSENAYVTGAGAALGKYDPEGNWVWAVDGSIAIEPGSDKLALDSSGNIYVTGYTDGGGTGLEITTLKHDPDGNQLWAASYNGTGNGADTASALALDSFGNVFVTGGSLGQGTGSDFVTIKYSQPDSGGDDSISDSSSGCLITTVAH